LAAVQDFQLHQKNLSELEASDLELPAKRIKYEKFNNLIARATKQVLTKSPSYRPSTQYRPDHPPSSLSKNKFTRTIS